MNEDWPVAGFDPVRRLRVLAAVTPGSAMTELTIPAPPELVWRVASDLPTEMPRLVRDFRSVTVTSVPREAPVLREAPVPRGAPGTGERLVMDARGYLGQRARFDVIMRPGWCWMQSRFLLCGMAAAPERGGTRFAFLGGIRTPGVRVPSPVLRLFRAAIRLDHLQTDIHRQLSGQ